MVVVERFPTETPGPASYRVLLLGLEGDTLSNTPIPYDPRPVTSGWVDRHFAREAAGPGGEAIAPCATPSPSPPSILP